MQCLNCASSVQEQQGKPSSSGLTDQDMLATCNSDDSRMQGHGSGNLSNQPILSEDTPDFVKLQAKVSHDPHIYGPSAWESRLLWAQIEGHKNCANGATPWECFNSLLDDVLSITGSEYGVILQKVGKHGVLHLQAVAITDISWTPKIKKLMVPDRISFRADKGGLHCISAVLEDSFVFNDPSSSVWSMGLPDGHPAIENLLTMPLVWQGQCIGNISIANRPKGYSPKHCKSLRSFCDTVATIMAIYMHHGDSLLGELHGPKLKMPLSSREMASMMMASPNHSIVAFDDGLHGVQCNKTFFSESGYTYDELKTMSMDNILPNTAQEAQSMISEGKNSTMVMEDMICAGKRKKYVSVTLGTVFSVARTWFIAVIASAADSLKARQESELRSSFERMLLSTSHDLRTPLQTIIHASSIFEMNLQNHDFNSDRASIHSNSNVDIVTVQPRNTQLSSDESLQAFVKSITAAARVMEVVVSNVLDMHRLQEGEVFPHTTSFCPMKLISDVCTSIQNSNLAKTGVHIDNTTGVHMTDRFFVSDVEMVRKILFNLVGNGVKYTDSGHVHVHFVIKQQNDVSKSELMFTVEDTGVGMSPLLQKSIFQPFCSTSTPESKATVSLAGTGLGLYITEKFVKLLGGSLQIDSKLGRGTRVSFTIKSPEAASLPKAVPNVTSKDSAKGQSLHNQAKDTPNDGHEMQISPSVRARPALAGLKVHLVEDVVINRRLGSRLIGSLGHHVSSSEDGDVAFEYVKENHDKIDVILMDLQMPRMSGDIATTLIRDWENQHQQSRIPIIAVTANVTEQDRQLCKAAGCDSFISKPLRVEVLSQHLNNLWDQGFFRTRPCDTSNQTQT